MVAAGDGNIEGVDPILKHAHPRPGEAVNDGTAHRDPERTVVDAGFAGNRFANVVDRPALELLAGKHGVWLDEALSGKRMADYKDFLNAGIRFPGFRFRSKGGRRQPDRQRKKQLLGLHELILMTNERIARPRSEAARRLGLRRSGQRGCAGGSVLERAQEQGGRCFPKHNGARRWLLRGSGNDRVQCGSRVGVCAKDTAFLRAVVAFDMPFSQNLGTDQRNGSQPGHHHQPSAAAPRILNQGSGIGGHVI